MTDLPDDADPDEPRSSRARGLFGFARRPKIASNGTDAPRTPAETEVRRDMRLRLAEFEAARVEDVMIPRADIVAMEISTPFDEIVKVFAEATHSRLPVYRGTLDDPVGFIHIKDIVAEIARDGEPDERTLDRLRRNILYAPPSMRLADLLVKMQATRIHLALVVDEYGGTDGLVSLEDLVEEIVGDIEDEHDEDAPLLTERGRGVWEADARMEIVDFAAEAGLDLSLPDYEDEIDTLGGVAFALAGRVPERGEILRHPAGADIEIIDADARRIRRLRLRARPDPSSETAA